MKKIILKMLFLIAAVILLVNFSIKVLNTFDIWLAIAIQLAGLLIVYIIARILFKTKTKWKYY